MFKHYYAKNKNKNEQNFPNLPNQTHLIPFFQIFSRIPVLRPEMYGLGKGDIHYVLANMPPATGVGNNGIYCRVF